MEFAKAFDLMKQGRKISLPHWADRCFWYWDAERREVMSQFIPADSDSVEVYEPLPVSLVMLEDIISCDWGLHND